MAKYEDIVGGSWEQRSVFPESIPHLFHHDLAYLWVLEQQPDQRPTTWVTRLEAWKLLLRLFFLDQVSVVGEDLRAPLLEVGERFGIRRVTWLRSRAHTPIGILSPTVIVRPLPDFSEGDLERWKGELKDNEREFNHLVFVAIKDLRRAAPELPFAQRIADLLQREFKAAESVQRPPAGRAITIPILNRVTWEPREGDPPPVGSVSLAVRAGGGRDITEYIPRCNACNRLLLYEETAPSVDVREPAITLLCPNPQCPSPHQSLALKGLGIWLRNPSSAVVWTPDRIPPMPDLELPPPPHITGNEVLFEWNAAAIGGEHIRRFLRLRFADRQVQQASLMSIFFDRLLVPGIFDHFQGSAIVPEWIDAEAAPAATEVRASLVQKQVEFRGLQIHGWPVPFSKFYKDLSLQIEPDLGVALFPDPQVVGPEWKWYRAFLQGTPAERYELQHSGGRVVLKSLASFEGGLPPAVGVRSSADTATGVSFMPRAQQREETYGGTATARIAVDFGTTNTLIYHQPPRTRLVARAESHGVEPRNVSRHVVWLADNQSWHNDEVLGNFLPGPSFRPGVADRYIIPSEVWQVGAEGIHLVRWKGEHPLVKPDKAVAPTTGFKWDTHEFGEEGFRPTRHAYLREILFQFLPVVMSAFEPARVESVRLGFSFPLAFDHDARSQFRDMLDEITAELSRGTGLRIDSAFSLNESKACVNAFGAFNGETFLVADMGGGTLDVALFTVESDATVLMHQMGSLRYAGEQCVRVLAKQLTPPGDVMQLRDAIARGESHKKFGKLSAENTATQFATVAFEMLRIMIAAYREQLNNEEEIRVVLVGNGWHLVESFSTETSAKGGRRVYHDVYGDLVAALGDPKVRFYDDRPLPEFPSSKHLVVAGALQNVTSDTSSVDELRQEEIGLARLPAGRSFDLGELAISWSQLVGEGESLPASIGPVASSLPIRIKIDEMPGTPPSTWLLRLANSLGVKSGPLPYPTEAELVHEMRESIGGTPRKLRRGPFQLILELEWAEALASPARRIR